MKKFFFIIVVSILLVGSISFYSIVNNGYDKQNKIILLIKEIIPSSVSRKIRDTIFTIPNLKERNNFLSLQVEKYEQGLEGNLFLNNTIKSNNNIDYNIKEFFLPFPRLDTRLGWAATKNSRRAHYFEIVKDKVLAISGVGQIIYFQKENLNKKKLNQIEIKNNLKNYLKSKKYELIGIRDLFIEDDYVYISVQHRDPNGFTINIYRAKLNFKELDLKPFFTPNEYWPKYNVVSGGRIETYKDNKILFSIGFAYVKSAAQNKNSFLGKIISIDKDTSKFELISIGHRNPQGLFYDKSRDLIINTEHGPKGGDEINLNFQKNKEIPNYGWDIASYGTPYSGEDFFKKSHAQYGFVEPFKNYTPSIGISEVVYISKKDNFNTTKNTLYASSLRAGSIYIINTNDDLSEITKEDRLFFKQKRIRDLEYDEDLNAFLILFEFTPSIGILSLNN